MTTDSIPTAPYVEVATAASAKVANKFLKAGYVLLSVQNGTQAHFPKGIRDGQFMVRKYPVFVVGRTAESVMATVVRYSRSARPAGVA